MRQLNIIKKKKKTPHMSMERTSFRSMEKTDKQSGKIGNREGSCLIPFVNIPVQEYRS